MDLVIDGLINSLRNKIDGVSEVFKKVQIDILCIDETKFFSW